MTIEKIKNNIDSKLGDNVKIIYNGSRNKKEEYSGIISETYNYIFIINVLTMRDHFHGKPYKH